MVHLQAAKREVVRLKEELGGERNHCITVKDKFSITLKVVVNRKVAKALERAHIEAKAENAKILEGPLRQLQPSTWPQMPSRSSRPTVYGKGSRTFEIWRLNSSQT